MAKLSNIMRTLPRLSLLLTAATAAPLTPLRFEAAMKAMADAEKEALVKGKYYGRTTAPPGPQNVSAIVGTLLVGSPVCLPEMEAQCRSFSECYDYGTTEPLCVNGTIKDVPQCVGASPLCDACYPYSRCGDDSGHFVVLPESSTCLPFKVPTCRPIASCYSHTEDCDETTGDHTDTDSSCDALHSFCQGCFPNSKCSDEYYEGPPDLPDCDFFDGLKRCWKIHVPAKLSDPPKLVMDLHGFTLDVDVQEQLSGFKELADEEGFVWVAPQGSTLLPGRFPLPSWNAGPRYFQREDKTLDEEYGAQQGGAAYYQGVDDVSFLTDLAARVADEHGINITKHVYWTGHSQGCAMSLRLAVEVPHKVAAVACMSYVTNVDQKTYDAYPAKNKKVPTLRIHGTFDQVIPNLRVPFPNTDLFSPGSIGDAATWRELNGCGDVAAKNCWVPATIEGDKEVPGYQVTGSDATSCGTGAAVSAISIPAAQHRPYRSETQGDPLPDPLLMPQTTDLAWGFMKRFPASDGGGSGVEWHPPCEEDGSGGHSLPKAVAYDFFVAESSAVFTVDASGAAADDLACASPGFADAVESALTDVVKDALADQEKLGLAFVSLTVGTQRAVCDFPFVVTVRFAEACSPESCSEATFNFSTYGPINLPISVVYRVVEPLKLAVQASAADTGSNGLLAKVGNEGGDTSDLTGVSASVGEVATRPASTRTVSPSAGVTVTVKIATDDYPGEVSWTLTDVCADSIAVIADVGDYDGKGVTYTTVVPARKSKYLFSILDAGGDGLCCNKGPNGSYQVYLDEDMVASGAEFGYTETAVFGSCTDADITFKPTNMLTASPTNNPTHAPTPDSTVTIEITTDDHPRETLWFLADTCNGNTQLDVGGDYTEEGANYTVTVPVEPSRFMFTMLDTGGDGVCCNHGTDGSYRVYYDGELVASGGEFGFSTLDMFGTCAGPQTSKPTNMVTAGMFN